MRPEYGSGAAGLGGQRVDVRTFFLLIQYGGMKSAEAKRLKELEGENKRLKRLVADQSLDIQMLKYVAEGNW